MMTKLSIVPALVAVLVTQAGMQAQAAEDRWNELRSLPFPENYPTEEAADHLHDESQLGVTGYREG